MKIHKLINPENVYLDLEASEVKSALGRGGGCVFTWPRARAGAGGRGSCRTRRAWIDVSWGGFRHSSFARPRGSLKSRSRSRGLPTESISAARATNRSALCSSCCLHPISRLPTSRCCRRLRGCSNGASSVPSCCPRPTHRRGRRGHLSRRGGGGTVTAPEPILVERLLVERQLAPLKFEVVAGVDGLEKLRISNPRIQKPGLALAGFLPSVKPGRLQILGESEYDFLRTFPADEAEKRLQRPDGARCSVRGVYQGHPTTEGGAGGSRRCGCTAVMVITDPDIGGHRDGLRISWRTSSRPASSCTVC